MKSADKTLSSTGIEYASRTVDTLRQIRTAIAPPSKKGFARFLNLLAHAERPTLDKQGQLRDAEDLVNTASIYFSRLVLGDLKVENQDILSEILDNLGQKYSAFKPSSRIRRSTAEVIEGLRLNLLYLSVDPKFVLDWHLSKYNNLGYSTVAEIIDHRVGIVAPLSTDFLTASIYRAYLLETKGNSIDVKPIVIAKDLERVVLPLDESGGQYYRDRAEIGVFMDIAETGKTGKVLSDALQIAYPDAKIHRFPDSNLTKVFTQSKKIRRLLGDK